MLTDLAGGVLLFSVLVSLLSAFPETNCVGAPGTSKISSVKGGCIQCLDQAFKSLVVLVADRRNCMEFSCGVAWPKGSAGVAWQRPSVQDELGSLEMF